MIERLRAADAAIDDPRAPLRAWGLDPIYFPGERLVAEHLDRVSTTRPILVVHASVHLATAPQADLEAGRLPAGTHADLERLCGRLERYIDRFGRENLLILLHDELSADPAGTLGRAFRFLEVDPDFRPDLEKRHHEARTPGKGPLARLAFAPEDTTIGRLAVRA